MYPSAEGCSFGAWGLNAILRERTLADAARTPHPEMNDKTVLEVFEKERATLVPWQGSFDGYAETTAAVSKTSLVSFDRNRYSVSAEAVGGPIQVRAYADRPVILQDGAVVGEHARVFARGTCAQVVQRLDDC